jgi:hypothetical protein
MAIRSSSLAHAASAALVVALTTISPLVKKPLVIAAILIAAAAVPAWRHAVSRPQPTTASSMPAEKDSAANAVPDTRAGHERRAIRSMNQPSPAAHGLALARIGNAAERDEALAAWMAEFSAHADIVALIAALRAEPESNTTLRALIAPHLTRRWATVDGAACIAAHLKEGGLFRRDPLDSNNNPFAARDSEATTPSVDLFRLIAETHPAAFATWLKSAPADLIPALLGDSASITWQAWAAADVSGEKTVRGMDPIVAQDFHKSDFANLIATRDPDLLLRPAVDGRDLGFGRRYYSGLMEKLGTDQNFSTTLMKSRTADELWDIFARVSELSPGTDHHTNPAFLKLAQAELVATPGTLESRATAAAALPASHRQATTLAVLFDSLDPASGGDYWAGVNTVAKAVHDIASKADAVAEVTLVNAYADLRSKIAGTLAKESIDEALEWTGSIRDQRNRASCLMQIAAQEIKPGVHAWASGQLGADEANEHVTMHFEDRTTDPPRVDQFTLPAVAGETLPQYYARLRAVLRKQLEAAPTVGR